MMPRQSWAGHDKTASLHRAYQRFQLTPKR